MTPEQLKMSILQMAIQGKLVEQRAEEGTAEELYQQIQAEKEKLISEGKIKREKPLASITEDEIPFDIPESWKWVKVGNIGSWASGATPSRTNPAYYGGTIPWLKTGDLNDGYISEVPEYITNLALENTSVNLNPVGSVLMAMYGATIGKLGILNIPMTTNQACCACNTFNGVFNKFLFYFLMSQRESYIGMAEGGAQPNISKIKIVNSLFPLPPLAEQKRIVEKIEELLPLVDRYATSYEKLEEFNAKFPEEMKKSILQYAIQGKLVEQRAAEGTAEELYQQIQAEKEKLISEGKIKKEKPLASITEDEIPFDIPDTWKWVRVSNVLVLENGDRSKKYPVETDYVDFGIPFFGAKDIVNNKMSFDNVRYISQAKYDELGSGKLVDKDMICLLRGSVGKIALFQADKNHETGFICAQMLIIRAINKDIISYLLHYFASPSYQSFINAKTTGTAVRQLPAKEIGNMLIPLPPLAEQKRIVAKIEELLPYCDQLIK